MIHTIEECNFLLCEYSVNTVDPTNDITQTRYGSESSSRISISMRKLEEIKFLGRNLIDVLGSSERGWQHYSNGTLVESEVNTSIHSARTQKWLSSVALSIIRWKSCIKVIMGLVGQILSLPVQ